MKAKKYTAQTYYTLADGLKIFDESAALCLTIHGGSNSEIAEMASKLLPVLNEPYYTGKAMIKDINESFEMGLYTPQERDEKINAINQLF